MEVKATDLPEFIPGQLVRSDLFSGVGKFHGTDESGLAIVNFFESPAAPRAREQHLKLEHLQVSVLSEKALVFCFDEITQIWRQGEYLSAIPGDMHRVYFKKDEYADLPLTEIYVLNAEERELSPVEFLAARSNNAPFFYPLRREFQRSYIEQRCAVNSIKSLSSSGIELEAHQLAVVRRVLTDRNKRYLLADEVGLGKTIEAAVISREHLLEYGNHARILIAVPEGMVGQWQHELSTRFQMEPFINLELEDAGDPASQVQVCVHQQLTEFAAECQPTMVVIDEAHQVAPWAWDPERQSQFYDIASCCRDADWALLLSGTPLHGNENNFLAMLHCLNPQGYELSQQGVDRFSQLVQQRELLSGLFSAITPTSDNVSLTDTIDTLEQTLSGDAELLALIEQVRPHIDWLSSGEGEVREQAINALRDFVGENYRLQHRMLRNRRDNKGIELLFPGLAGAKQSQWSVGPVSTEYLFESYRASAIETPDQYPVWHLIGLDAWLEAAVASPMSLAMLARDSLDIHDQQLAESERELLNELYQVGRQEQRSMDDALTHELQQWLDDGDGKAVVFCDSSIEADRIAVKLQIKLGHSVTRHNPDEPVDPLPSHTRVLVCDRRGEDGLNMHGGSRLAVHYSLPLDCGRIEQRLGRFNRYSGNLPLVKPVESLVLVPEHNGLRRAWMALLDNGLRIFNRTTASYQHALAGYFDGFWRRYGEQGITVLDHAITELEGSDGLLEKERIKVSNQEQLLAMEADVAKAFGFSQQMRAADEKAEEEFKAIQNWIKQALHFQSRREKDGVRFSFEIGGRGPKTAVDIDTLLQRCIVGFDGDAGYPPSTHIMTPSRTISGREENIYPLRYGQPFVDQIWQMMQHDPRGLSCAFLRFVNIPLSEPKPFFRLDYFRNVERYKDYNQQRQQDESRSPQFFSVWVDQNGNAVDPQLIVWLEKPYSKSSGSAYQDLNLRPEVWQQMTAYFPQDHWQRLVTNVTTKITDEQQGLLSHGESIRVIGMQAVILCSKSEG
ncbi:protein DpdE [Ferrimonas senticii]|uniref:protein DpdE n=1 Tax=Ferrimonas senticii TaxID=394566 RepID=UPI0004236AC9|nr:protein DpdE [Ferrimonas senticii]